MEKKAEVVGSRWLQKCLGIKTRICQESKTGEWRPGLGAGEWRVISSAGPCLLFYEVPMLGTSWWIGCIVTVSMLNLICFTFCSPFCKRIWKSSGVAVGWQRGGCDFHGHNQELHVHSQEVLSLCRGVCRAKGWVLKAQHQRQSKIIAKFRARFTLSLIIRRQNGS